MSISACNCGDDGNVLSQLKSQIEVTPEALAFGEVPLGAVFELPLSIKNIGTDILKICVEDSMSIECKDVSRVQPDAGPFHVLFENLEEDDGTWSVAKQDTRDLMVQFAPQTPEEFTGTLILVHNASNGPTTTIQLSGKGVEPQLTINPDKLEFGEVTAGMRKTLDLTLTNPTQFTQRITIAPPMQDSVIFGLADPANNALDVPVNTPAMTEVPGNGTLTLKVWFQPLEEQAYENTLVINYCPTCQVNINMSGTGIKPAFELVPASLSFGTVDEAMPVMRNFAVVNIGRSPLTVTAIGLENGTTNEFSVSPRQPVPFVVPPMSQLDVDVTYTGVTPGLDMGRVQVDTNAWNDPATPINDTTKFVALDATSQGPDIDALPPIVNFGTVAVGGSATRNLIIQNAGNAPLTINSATFNSMAPEITIVMQPSFPVTIQPANSIQFTFGYNPVSSGIDEGDLVLLSNDRDEGMLSVHVQGLGGVPTTCSISVAPTQVTFGLVERGRQVTLPVEIKNSGAQPCLVSNLVLNGAAEFAFGSAPPSSVSIAPGNSHRLDLVYSPPDYGNHSTLFEFDADDPAQAHVSVPVSGSSAPSDLLVIPSSLDFNVVPVLCRSPVRQITLYNTGGNTITVTAVYLDPSTSAEFELTPVSVPMNIPAGASRVLEMRYHPIDIGVDTGVLFISHSNSLVPVAVPLSGEGAINPTVTDTFSQLPTPQADVLFVVDNSGSMSEEQNLLGQNIGSFVQFAQQQMIDYQISVTTTDVDWGQAGWMTGNPTFITPSTPNGLNVFEQRVDGLGTGGSGDEQGLEAAYLALSDPLINTQNAGFLRQDAALAVVLVSDEEDSSPNTTTFYENFFRNIKGFQNASLFSFSAIVGPAPSGCFSGNGSADAGNRYISVAQATGGVVESICNVNWGQTLANIGLNSFGLRRSFQLSSQPVPVTIAVTVDNVATPSTTPAGQNNWNYDQATNSVIFTTVATPDANSVITVTYSVACLP